MNGFEQNEHLKLLSCVSPKCSRGLLSIANRDSLSNAELLTSHCTRDAEDDEVCLLCFFLFPDKVDFSCFLITLVVFFPSSICSVSDAKFPT